MNGNGCVSLCLLYECVWVSGNEWVSECLSLECHSCAQTLDGPWTKMSRA